MPLTFRIAIPPARSTTTSYHEELRFPSDKPTANGDRVRRCLFTPPSGPHGVADEGSPRWKRPSSARDHDWCVSYTSTASLLATTFHFVFLFPPNTLLQCYEKSLDRQPLVPSNSTIVIWQFIDVQCGLLLSCLLTPSRPSSRWLGDPWQGPRHDWPHPIMRSINPSIQHWPCRMGMLLQVMLTNNMQQSGLPRLALDMSYRF